MAGGVGAAPVYPQVKWMHEHGIDVDVIVGTKSKEFLILEDQMRAVAGNLYITTDDGSYVQKGMVTDVLKELVEEEGKKYDVCVAIGPMIMMKFVCLMTKEASDSDRCQHESDHGGRHRHVRRLPSDRGQ